MAANASLLDLVHPLETEWRRITADKQKHEAWSVPAVVSGSREDDIVVTVARAEDRDTKQRLVGYSLIVVAIDCRRERFSMGDMQQYDARGRKTVFTKANEDTLTVTPVGKGSVVEALMLDVCATAKTYGKTPAPKAKAQPQLSSGTGWLSERGYIVTASHVVAGAERIVVYQEGRRVGEAQVVAEDPDNDVAILRPSFDVSGMLGLKLRAKPTTLGQHVFTLGYPLADLLGVRSVKMASGDVTGLTGVGAAGRPDDPRYAQISIPVQSGNSGGPIIDTQGAVAGIVIAKASATEDELLQNLNFALKGGYIAALLGELPQAGRPRAVDPANPDRVAAVKDAIFLIMVESR